MASTIKDRLQSTFGLSARANDAKENNVYELIIGDRQSIIGDVSFSGTIRIDGFVEGDVTGKRIVITESATVNGAVSGESIFVEGTVNGPVEGEKVTLEPTANVKGNISYGSLTVGPGASICGVCKDNLDTVKRSEESESPCATQPLPFNMIKPFATKRRAPMPQAAVAQPTSPIAQLPPVAAPQKVPATQAPPPRKARNGRRSSSMRAVWETLQETEGAAAT